MTPDSPSEPPAPRRTKRVLAREATGRTILETARRLFRERGYAAVTIRDLAAAMNRSTGAVFAHYPNKEAVWAAAMGCPAPDIEMAEQLARLQSAHPDYGWTLSRTPDGRFEATARSPRGDVLRAEGLTGGQAVEGLIRKIG